MGAAPNRVVAERLSPSGSFEKMASRVELPAYEAPFPSPKYKMACRAMPSHVPIIPDKSLDAQKKAREFFNKTDKPFLSVFAGNDPVTNDMEKDVLNMVPNAIKAKNIGGGHFFQWTKPKELSKVLIDFIED